MKRVNHGLSIMMTLLLCVCGFNFSLIASAEEANVARIIGFNPLDESIASQTLPIGASIGDVILPDTLKAAVEVAEEPEEPEATTEESIAPNDDTEPATEDASDTTEEGATDITEDEVIDTGDVDIESFAMVGRTSEITIENVTWQLADGVEFDSGIEDKYTFKPVFTTDYVIAVDVPTITVNIVNTNVSQSKTITVTFKVVNGAWDDETTEDKVVTISGEELKLTEDLIPKVGNKPKDSKYKTGSWDKIPSVDELITESTTFTYTYTAKKAAVIVKAPEARTLYYFGETN